MKNSLDTLKKDHLGVQKEPKEEDDNIRIKNGTPDIFIKYW